jgi:DnaJ-class molecular chaperone
MFPRSYYAVLRVPEDADSAAIRHAYRNQLVLAVAARYKRIVVYL